nr:hypothetical protein [Tanacetum cinerariifolium]
MWEDFVYQVKHKDTKKSNEMYYPWFTKVIIHRFISKDPSIPRRNNVNWNYVRDEYMFSIIKLEYYAVATGATTPKPKASVWKSRSSFDTTTPPTTAAASPRLTTSEKAKQAAKSSKAKSLFTLFKVAMIEAQQLKLATKRSLQQTHISQASGSGADEGTGSIPGVPDVPTDESEEELSWNSTDEEGDNNEGKDGDGDEEDDGDDDDDDGEEGNDDDDQEDEGDDLEDYEEDEGGDDEQASDEEKFIHSSLSTHTEEEIRDEESFDPIPKTPKNSDDKGNGEEDLGLNVGREEGHDEEEEEDKLYRYININQGRDNNEFLKTIDENMKNIIKEQVKEQVKVEVSKILPRIEQTVNEQLAAKVLTRHKSIHRSNEQRNLYKALVEAYESDKIILDTYRETVTLKRRHDDDADKDEEPFTSTNESTVVEEPMQTTFEMEEPSHPEFETGADDQLIVESSQHPEWFAQQQKPPTLDLDFSNFLINQLKVDTLTLELLAGPTYELLKGSCKSLVKLEYHLEEVYKATTDQLDWVNPEGQQYPHNLLKPLPLIPNNRGCRVIPFDYFINNDLAYLRGGASRCKYTTSVTKTKAADYGHIKWIEDLVPRTMWIQEPIGYDKHALCRRRIIAVTELKIVEWQNYKHLDWITLRRDDDKLYKFKEGDFKRLRIQDIEDMLLLLHRHPKAYGRPSTGCESYQKNLNLTKPDTYCPDLKIKEAYVAYSIPRGFIYQNKDKKNRLVRIDELHKFNDGTLIDVCTALDDRLKGIRMQYLPQSIWRKSDKDRVAAMIQAIDKRLKTKRVMRSLERFVGGRLYEGDFRMLQRTI